MIWISVVIVLGSVWFSIASFVGAYRLRFWPLLLQGMAFAIISILLTIISKGDYPREWYIPLLVMVIVGYICIYWYEFKLRAGRRLLAKGITIRKLLLFQK